MNGFNDSELLTEELLTKIINSNFEFQQNDYLNYLVKNHIIDGISVKNFKKIWEFISKSDIYNVYDYNFINLLCKNIVLLYSDIDDSEIEDIEDPEEEQEVYRVKTSINAFYEIINNGNLKKFDLLVNIIMGNNQDKRKKIKLMIDIAPNFDNFLELIDDIIKSVKSLEDLRRFIDTCHNVQTSRIKSLTEDDLYGEAKYMVKNEITKLLTNVKYYGRESLDTIGFETSSLKELRNSIKDESIKEELSKYILFMSLIDSILSIDDLRKLKVIACRISNFKNNNDSIYTIYNYTEHMAKRIKEIYAHEIKEKLFNFNNLENGNNQLYSRANSKFTADSKMLYDEDITGRKVDYIELSGIDYVSLVHVLNAYGEGGALKDFKTPRIIGKEYICLSAIDETKEKIAKSKQDDEEHVCLLFSSIEPDQLISESFEDLYSYGGLNSLSITFDKRENFRPIKKQIQLNKGSHTEFVLYRDSSSGKPIYPSGILIQNASPTQVEINAAAYLNIPIVFINHEKYNDKFNQVQLKEEHKEPYKPTTEEYRLFRESLIELRDSISGKGKGR